MVFLQRPHILLYVCMHTCVRIYVHVFAEIFMSCVSCSVKTRKVTTKTRQAQMCVYDGSLAKTIRLRIPVEKQT